MVRILHRLSLVLLGGSLLLGGPLRARESESTPAGPVAALTIELHEGWNLLSAPLTDPELSWNRLLEDIARGGETVEQADLLLTVDPASGQWHQSWLHSELGWVDLPAEEPQRERAFWLLLRPRGEQGPGKLTFAGSPLLDASCPRGSYEAGLHLIGGLWSEPLALAQAGLSESGLTGQASPVDLTGELAAMLLSFDGSTQTFEFAWLSDEGWRGQLDTLLPGRGYLLYLPTGIDWQDYPRPDLAGGDASGGPEAAARRGAGLQHKALATGDGLAPPRLAASGGEGR